jgi:6-pyruvoyltetrahydropterin/6-carboxytetrahydropterin synthase
MHKLTRQVRFSVNPFLAEQTKGANSFASMPTGEGLAFFFELAVELVSQVDKDTGFIVNVSEIDSNVRKFAVPVFVNKVKEYFQKVRHMDFFSVTETMRLAWKQLEDKFAPARLNKLSLKLNPFRKITLDSEDSDMIFFSEKFEFAATHKLWNTNFTDMQNRNVFGKCANLSGHGHNYIIEVTIKMSDNRISNSEQEAAIADNFSIGDFEKIVDSELISIIDHKNLNLDIKHFAKVLPTVENIAIFAWEKLSGKFPNQLLHCVTVWETDKTSCSYYG